MSGDGSLRRFDIVAETRRRWSREEKLAIVTEASVACTNISAVARRHGIKPALLYRWKKELGSARPASSAPAFVPLAIAAPEVDAPDESALAATGPRQTYDARELGEIEILLANGRRIRAHGGIEPLQLKRIIDAVES